MQAQAAVLLLDEDTCATNLMVRDERMRAMVPGEREPITPFVDRVGALYAERGVSSILVTGGSGAFLDVADLVMAMDAYRAVDVTDRAAIDRVIMHAEQQLGPVDLLVNNARTIDPAARDVAVIFYYPEFVPLWERPEMWEVARDFGLIEFWRETGLMPDLCHVADRTR